MKLELKHIVGYLPYDLRIKNSTTEMPLTGAYLDELNDPLWGFDDTYKPILRPLSDLTKEIEVNREKFVPSQEYDYLRFEEISTFKGGCNAMKFIQVRELELLYEMHFDIHGLIEQGLAISKNTLP